MREIASLLFGADPGHLLGDACEIAALTEDLVSRLARAIYAKDEHVQAGRQEPSALLPSRKWAFDETLTTRTPAAFALPMIAGRWRCQKRLAVVPEGRVWRRGVGQGPHDRVEPLDAHLRLGLDLPLAGRARRAAEVAEVRRLNHRRARALGRGVRQVALGPGRAVGLRGRRARRTAAPGRALRAPRPWPWATRPAPRAEEYANARVFANDASGRTARRWRRASPSCIGTTCTTRAPRMNGSA